MINTDLIPPPLSLSSASFPSFWFLGEICAFNIHGLEAPFEAVVLNGTSGEGQLRARGLVDCELQKEYTFIIQAHDCGSGPKGTEGKKSHKWVRQTAATTANTTGAFDIWQSTQVHIYICISHNHRQRVGFMGFSIDLAYLYKITEKEMSPRTKLNKQDFS